MTTMSKHMLIAVSLLLLGMGVAQAAGDPVAGERKAAACVSCHGNKHFSGFFFTLQLAGRDPDKLVIKTNKYRTGKIINPMMNFIVSGLSDQDVEDIAAYYHSLEKPAYVHPYLPIKGDDDEEQSSPFLPR
ncbi:MAG: hypothetical protein Kow006_02270 [Gammaproteobacteria bacterium]